MSRPIFTFFWLQIICCCFDIYCQSLEITVGTFNLWNVMFNWRTRIEHIADIIKEHDIDIVAFQEVQMRRDQEVRSSQLDAFRTLLPKYKWIAAYPARQIDGENTAYKSEWNYEGLGLISQKEILWSSVIKMAKIQSEDRNPRIALHVEIKLGPSHSKTVDVFVVHFSYDRQEQCWNAVDILRTIKYSKSQNIIILGDFNVYSDFESAFSLFTSKKDPTCFTSNYNISNRGLFKDAWVSAGQEPSAGLTFSNMPTPGLQSRPDRILVSQNISVKLTALAGNGTYYKKYYYNSIILNRAKSVLYTSYDAYRNRSGYYCSHDCGPHGSCRCGICVSLGNQLSCETPHCFECNRSTFTNFFIFIITFLILTTILFYSILKIFFISAKLKARDVFEIFGYKCCLFNKHLFRFSPVSRNYRYKFQNFLFLCRLPPWLLLIVMLMLLGSLSFIFSWIFSDSILLVYLLLPEELFPSDHLFVFSRLEI